MVCINFLCIIPKFGRGRDNREEHAIQIKPSEGSVDLAAIDIEGDDGYSEVQGTANHITLLDPWY